MKTYFLFLLLSFSLPYISLQSNQPSSKEINQFVEKEMNALQIPGMAVAVIKDGKLLHQGTYGIANVEWNQKVTPKTAFQIASVTKLFTSTLVMKYIQDGKIDLDESVLKYLPDAPEAWKEVRIKHLLSHQSGIPWPASIGGYIGTGPANSDKPVSKEQVYKDMRDSLMVFNPGEKESYINGDAFVLQFVLEKIGGKSIDEIFREELFGPLQMEGSGFDGEIRNFPTQVMKPIKNKSQLFTKGNSEPLVFKTYYNPSSYSSGGLYTTLEDAVKWAVSLDKADFIDREIVEQLSSKMPLNGSFTALGWNRQVFNNHEAFGHTGGPGLGDILHFPEQKFTIIVFSNYADMYPFMAASIASMFFPDIVLPSGSKTLDRGFYKMY